MSRLPDLVLDSRLHTTFHETITVHSYLEIDKAGGRFSREEHWKQERFLGRGGFGQVRLERCIGASTKPDSLRAVKIINKPLHSSESLDLNRELEAIAKFSNRRYKRWFVKSFGWFEDPNSIFITMEYCRHGDLHHYLRNNRVVAAGEVQQLVRQMLEGLDQMHHNDFAHRDLKPGNILIKSMPPEEKWWIVLADFGISKRADESNGPITTIKGTAAFMAPELLGYLDQFRPKSIDGFKAADIWALGEIAFQMLTGETTSQNPMELMRYCLGQREFPSDRIPISAGDESCEFITSIMKVIPHDRMTTNQCLQHRWMESRCVEKKIAALNVEQTGQPVQGNLQNKLNSARWSGLSDFEPRAAQKPVQQGPAMPLHSNLSDAPQTLARPRSTSPSTQQHLNHVEKPHFLTEMVLLYTLEGHEDVVWAVAFSPNGKRLASASSDGTVRLWDAWSGKLAQTLKGHGSSVYSIDFSPDGSRLVSASYDMTMRLWNAMSGDLLQTFKGHTSIVHFVVFSPDGKRLVSVSEDRTVRLWDTRWGEQIQTIIDHKCSVSSVVFSPDGKWLASASSDSTVRLWNARSGESMQTFKAHTSSVYSVGFSPDGNQLVSASYDKTVRLWDARSGELMQTLRGHTASVSSVVFSPDGNRLASASSDCTVRLWDAWSGKLVQTLKGHSSSVYSVVFSPDGKRLVSASYDMTVRLWDAWSGELVQTLKGYTSLVHSVVFSPDGKRLASASEDSTVQLWEVSITEH